MNAQTIFSIRRRSALSHARLAIALLAPSVAACSDDARSPHPIAPLVAAPAFGKNVTGSNQRILFSSLRDGAQYEIYSMKPDGSSVTRLTMSSGNDLGPAWSPDGKQIAFYSDRAGSLNQIYVMNSDGTGVQQLTFGPGLSVLPSWSKDGKQLVFATTRDAVDPTVPKLEDFEIYVMNTDGTGLTRLTTNGVPDFAPAWSPDGRRIAFISGRDHPGDSAGDLYTMNVDGSNVTRLTIQNEMLRVPRWDPHARRLAFFAPSGIYVVTSDGSGLTRLTFVYDEDGYPTWSPDGAKLAFESSRDGNGEIYVMNADGTAQTRLTTSPTTDGWPSWSR
jgi:Tol biopolymer transport system component